MQRRDDGMGMLTADLTADGLTTVWNALDAHARRSESYTGRTQGDDRSLGQRRADGLVEVCAAYLDDTLAGDLDYRPDHDTTGWSHYRPTPAANQHPPSRRPNQHPPTQRPNLHPLTTVPSPSSPAIPGGSLRVGR